MCTRRRSATAPRTNVPQPSTIGTDHSGALAAHAAKLGVDHWAYAGATIDPAGRTEKSALCNERSSQTFWASMSAASKIGLRERMVPVKRHEQLLHGSASRCIKAQQR